ncbi:MAG: transporter [Actinomycetia bacterium]|nr:transporter [Actinomycetes bacterium]
MNPPGQVPAVRPVVAMPLDPPRVGWRFISLYALSYAGGSLLFLGPLLVSLALKVNHLVGIDDAPKNLALVTGVGSLFGIVSNPFFGRLSDRTTSRMGMRRPWMIVGLAGGAIGTLTVALAPTIGVVLVGWCIAQVFLNALLAAQIAILPDQVPTSQRGLVSGILGVCLPAASVAATFLVQAFDVTQLSMFLAPLLLGGVLVGVFTASLHDRRLDPATKPPWSLRQFAESFYVSPRANPDFAWAFASRFLLVMAYAFLVTYQAYYLIDRIGVREDDVAHQIYLGTLVQSVALVLASPLAGRLSDRLGRRKIFVALAAVTYAVALVMIAIAQGVGGYLVGMALSGVGFGMYMAVDLALVVDVLPGPDSAAKDLGVLNIAGALPFALAPAVAPVVLGLSDNSYSALYLVAGACALLGAVAIIPIRRVR